MNFDHVRELCAEAWTAEGLSEKTIQAYLTVLTRAERELEARGTDVLSATAREIRELAESFPITRASRMQLRCALGRCWMACERRGGPVGAVVVPTKPRYTCRALSEPEAALLARTARSWPGPAGLAVMLGLYAGLRNNEIASLRWRDVDLASGWIRVVGKGDVTAELPIHPLLADRLVLARPKSPFVFPGSRGRDHVTRATVWNWVRLLSADAIRTQVAPHRLRHTAIATLNDATGDLRLAQTFARHASPSTTVLYTRVSRRRLERAVQAIDYDAVAEAAL